MAPERGTPQPPRTGCSIAPPPSAQGISAPAQAQLQQAPLRSAPLRPGPAFRPRSPPRAPEGRGGRRRARAGRRAPGAQVGLRGGGDRGAVSAGSVLDQSLESLLHRLRGLCDNMEPETFLDHEMVFLLKGQQASPFVLRARRSMDKSGMPWHLRYLGQPEIGDKNRHALVRNCVDIATSDNLTDFLVEMGFRMDHEFVAKGHVFRKGIMKIVVYKIFRILMPGNTESIEPLSLSYLVELNVVAPAGQDIVSDDMRNFAEQLKPLVHLEKIDPKRLM
ncbi:PREDICTED: mediator of RNA polymerase II transcription subunit 18 [Ficedula albicollis]|uniref:mediator of RNA polymerase II transcription subunit 18 n=1 Tax=Ficedula albicollis TaxID=59894 RepID=UPI00035A10B4|nr:PREDICTED: mediator of RNA polymerase II transcription subunit 18 [Ficedula albicollis]